MCIHKRFRALLSIIGLILLAQNAVANSGEESRVLVQTLNYLANDYVNAVDETGKIISADEYKEMLGFAQSAVKYQQEFSKKWSASVQSQTKLEIAQLDSVIKAHAKPSIIAVLAKKTKEEIIVATGLVISPLKYPDSKKGKLVFVANCAKCHGDNGFGDGKEGIALQPPPRNFHDSLRMNKMSPLHIFNTVRVGIAGTGMKPHPTLSDEEVWAVAFYVSQFRFTNPHLHKDYQALPLQEIATKSDEELLPQINPPFTVADVRLFELSLKGFANYLKTANDYLDECRVAVGEKDFAKASKLATMAYLEGVEPIENSLKEKDFALFKKFENEFTALRNGIDNQESPEIISQKITANKKMIETIAALDFTQNSTFWMACFMALTIILREGLEAFLVILILLSILKNNQQKSLIIWIHLGWLCALAVGFLGWFIGQEFILKNVVHLELLEGIMSLVAVFMLLYIGFWLHSHSAIEKWKARIKKNMESASAKKSALVLGSVSFLVVFREVFESVLFLSALNLESGNHQDKAIGFGVLLALMLVGILAVAVIRFTARLPLAKLFSISTWVMAILSVILMGKAMHAFQEVGKLSIHSLPIPSISLLGIFSNAECLFAQCLLVVLIYFLQKRK